MQEVKKEKRQISKAVVLFDWYCYGVAIKGDLRVAFIQLS